MFGEGSGMVQEKKGHYKFKSVNFNALATSEKILFWYYCL